MLRITQIVHASSYWLIHLSWNARELCTRTRAEIFFFYLKHATFSIEAFNRRIVQRYVHTDSPYADTNIILDGAYVPT